MTFADITRAVQGRLNLTSPDSLVRIGNTVNDRYKRVTSALGINLSRRTTVNVAVTVGNPQVTFPGEKIVNIVDRSVNPYRILKEISVEELRATQPSPNTFVSYYCIVGVAWNSVTVEMDCVPAVPFILYADVLQNATNLSGTMEPQFPESFHDILVHGALEDEYLKLEKVKLAQDSGIKYAQRLSDLRFFLSKSSYMDWVQGKTRGTIYEEGVPGAGGGSGGASLAILGAPTGSVIFTAAGGPLIQDGVNFFYDPTREKLQIGVGDETGLGAPANASNPFRLELMTGTYANPVATVGPTMKINRVESIPLTQMTNGQSNDQNAGIFVVAVGRPLTQVQSAAIVGAAYSYATSPASGGTNPDACGLQGTGHIFSGGVGRGVGGYFEGIRDTTASTNNGIEVRSNNNTSTPDAYVAGQIPNTMGIWVTATGATSAVGIVLGSLGTWDVGLAFPFTNINTTTISDDSNSTTSVAINGTHTTSIAVAPTAGAVRLGTKILKYNNIPTAAGGVPAIYGFNRLTGQTTALASVVSYTVGAVDGAFLVTAYVRVVTSVSHNFQVGVQYTDEIGVVQTQPFNFASTLVVNITDTTGVGAYHGFAFHIHALGASTITIYTAGTFTSVVYNIEGSILQIA